MTLIFTATELEWINKELFHWSIKDGCPENLKKGIQTKLRLLYGTANKEGSK